MSVINRFLLLLQGRQDLALVAILLASITVMILPLPAIAIDVFLALNITLTILILIVAVYLDRPTSFSTFPAIILIATTFRLSLSISTTRTILTEAEGGSIIETFGTFVTGGNLAVGLVIFLIITIVQFVVITKGAERVAEVAARFVLDALPGRQMSIDAELRSGDIDNEEARRRRRLLDKENQFFGAMDGAMKFVKGDAIAGLLIIIVNLIGGITIGLVQHGMTFTEAANTFSLLTIGDGLVAQIPALLIALGAGAVVTRVASDEKKDLGQDIAAELGGSSRTLVVAGSVVALLGFVPGFPTLFFAAFGGVLIWMGVLVRKRQAADAQAAEEPKAESVPTVEKDTSRSEPSDRVVLRLGAALAARVDGLAFSRFRADALRANKQDTGLELPRFGIKKDQNLEPDAIEIDLDGVSMFTASLPAGDVVAKGDEALITLAGATARKVEGWPIDPGYFIPEIHAKSVADAGVEVIGVADLIVRAAMHAQSRNRGMLIGFDKVHHMIRDMQTSEPQLAEQVVAAVPVGRFLEIVRRLVSEQVPLVPIRTLFEALAEAGSREEDPAALAEQVRRALRRQICRTVADDARIIGAYIVEPDLERALLDAIQRKTYGEEMVLTGQIAQVLLGQLSSIATPLDAEAPPPVIVTAGDLRRHLKAYLDSHGLQWAVLAFSEIAPEFSLQPVGTLSLHGKGLRAAA
jgi:type III secretion protein V